MRAATFVLSSALIVAGPAAAAPPASRCVPTVSGAWVRMAPASMPMGAAFAIVHNRCGAGAEITDVDSPDFAGASLHESTLSNGVSRMRALDRVLLPAGKQVEFRPGGKHIMLMRPRRVLTPGKVATLRFRLADGRSVTAEAQVRDTAP